MPIGTTLNKIDCPSMNETLRRTKKNTNKVRFDNSTLLKVVTCVACNKESGLCGNRKHVTKEHLR